jgi:hypothetical protein
MQPYWFDDSQRYLPCGATSMWIFNDDFDFDLQLDAGDTIPLLIQTDLPGESIREVVHLISAVKTADPIYLTGGKPTPVTYITWEARDALTREHDLRYTHLAGNLLPATQGQRFTESFAIGAAPAGSIGTPVASA